MTPNDDTKPSHRKLWHDLVDRAVHTAIASGTPFTVERVLDSVGIHSLSLHRERAVEYATKMLDAHTKAATTNPAKERKETMPELTLDRVADVLDIFRARYTHEALDVMFAKTNVLSPSFGRTDYLRRVLRESTACDANFNEVMTACNASGLIIDRRAAFRMGIVLGVLVADDMQKGRNP
jgi:hypothetical protein